jgi:hypothetical protein
MSKHTLVMMYYEGVTVTLCMNAVTSCEDNSHMHSSVGV